MVILLQSICSVLGIFKTFGAMGCSYFVKIFSTEKITTIEILTTRFILVLNY